MPMKQTNYSRDDKVQNNTERINLFKEAMSNYPTGVSIVTANDESDGPIAVNMDPTPRLQPKHSTSMF